MKRIEAPKLSPAAFQRDQSVSSISDLVIFCDFDGPIVDVSDRYYQTYCLGLAETQTHYKAQGQALNLHCLSKEQFWHMKQNRTPDPEIAMRSGLEGEQIERFLQQVQKIVNQPDLLHCDRLQPGVRWALSLLHAQGATLVLVTLRCQAQAVQFLQNYDLIHLFRDIRGAQDKQAAYTNHADHKTQLLATAVKDFYPADQSTVAWMIGDTEADVIAGKSLNIPTIALTCGIRSRTYLERFRPTRLHNDLLSTAHYLVQSNYTRWYGDRQAVIA